MKNNYIKTLNQFLINSKLLVFQRFFSQLWKIIEKLFQKNKTTNSLQKIKFKTKTKRFFFEKKTKKSTKIKTKNSQLRVQEPEPKKPEELEAEQQAVLAAAAGGVAGVGAGPSQAMTVAGAGTQLNANLANAANSAKKDPNTVPYRYCMPTHAVYTPPVPTARNNNSNSKPLNILNQFQINLNKKYKKKPLNDNKQSFQAIVGVGDWVVIVLF